MNGKLERIVRAIIDSARDEWSSHEEENKGIRSYCEKIEALQAVKEPKDDEDFECTEASCNNESQNFCDCPPPQAAVKEDRPKCPACGSDNIQVLTGDLDWCVTCGAQIDAIITSKPKEDKT